VPAILTTLLALCLLVGAGVVAIVTIRRRWLTAGDDRGDWERTLVDCKNLRDEGVLSEEEFRKIRTLVEPRTRVGMPDPKSLRRPPADSPVRTLRGHE
jgi:hypothetical protein